MSDLDRTTRWRRVEGWIHHAEDDARIARSCIALDPPALGGAAYHCQQAAEKLLKGFLVQAEIDFRKTHDLSVLGDLVVSAFPRLKLLVMAMEVWTTWAVAFRYPAENLPEPEPDSAELCDALELIAKLEALLRSLAPSADKAS